MDGWMFKYMPMITSLSLSMIMILGMVLITDDWHSQKKCSAQETLNMFKCKYLVWRKEESGESLGQWTKVGLNLGLLLKSCFTWWDRNILFKIYSFLNMKRSDKMKRGRTTKIVGEGYKIRRGKEEQDWEYRGVWEYIRQVGLTVVVWAGVTSKEKKKY